MAAVAVSMILELLCLLPLCIALYLGWKERRIFPSLTPFVVAMGLFLVARACDILIQEQSLVSLAQANAMKSLDLVSDVTDTVGVFLLVLGFVRSIQFQRTEERRIKELESLLPICAWCKHVRVGDGSWKSPEEYLAEKGRQTLTHGICPSCRGKFQREATAATLNALRRGREP